MERLTLLKEIKGVGMLGFDAGFFQNLSLSGLDYYYGLTISVGQEFFLGKVKKKSRIASYKVTPITLFQ